MICVVLKANRRQRLNRLSRRTEGFLISSALICLGVWSIIFNCFCKGGCISDTKFSYSDKHYLNDSHFNDREFIHIMRSLKKYENELIMQGYMYDTERDMIGYEIQRSNDRWAGLKRGSDYKRERYSHSYRFEGDSELSKKNSSETKLLSKVNRTQVQLRSIPDLPVRKNQMRQERIDRHQNISKKAVRRLPQAIIVGVKKCGTRALLEYLRLHPDIRAPGPEPHFFDRYYHLGLKWYSKKMPPTIEGQITIEKTPRYFVMPEVPVRISNMSNDIKLIIVVRDPVTRAISDFTQGSSKDPNVTETFVEKAFHRNGTGGVHKNWSALKTGIYVRHVKRWLNYFSLSQMHFVSGENLVRNPAQEVQNVTDFLGLKRVISDKHFYFNETKGFPCLKKHESSPEKKCFDRSKGRPHPHVEDIYIQRLKQFFKPYNEEFYQLIGKDFGWS